MTHWATELIGKPWVYGAQGPDEFDCWGFVRYVQRVQYGFEMPDIAVPDRWVEVQHLLSTHDEHKHWNQITSAEAKDGDVVIMARNKIPVHIGIALNANGAPGVLHCFQPSGVVFQHIPALKIAGWGRLTYYRRAP